MADEITMTASLSIRQSATGLNQTFSRNTSLDLTASPPNMSPGIVEIGTTHEAISFGDVAAAGGVAWVQNLDDTNFVSIGRDVAASFYGTIRIPPLTGYPIVVDNTALYAKADTAACDVLIAIFDP